MSSPDKKRKLGSDSKSNIQNVSIKPVVGTTEAVVLSLGGIELKPNAQFEAFKSKKTGKILVHGEAEPIQYEGLAENEYNYCLAAYDPTTKSAELFQVPVITLNSIVKSQTSKARPDIRQANVKNMLQRNALGEAFGTKKAKKAISDLERNRIDADKLEDFEVAIVETVKSSTANIPTVQEVKDALSSDRPIPVYDDGTDDVDEIYPVSSIIPAKEFAAIRVAHILKETDEEKRLALLPHKSSYLAQHLAAITDQPHPDTDKLKLIYYTSLLLAVLDNKRASNKTALIAKLETPPEILVNGILDRFASAKAGQFGKSKDRSFVIDSVHEDKLLCYLLALILRLDNYLVRIPPLAQELSLKPSKVNELFKALGCSIKNCTVAQAEALGISRAVAANYKLASLSAPLKLPEVARRKRQGARR